MGVVSGYAGPAFGGVGIGVVPGSPVLGFVDGTGVPASRPGVNARDPAPGFGLGGVVLGVDAPGVVPMVPVPVPVPVPLPAPELPAAKHGPLNAKAAAMATVPINVLFI